MDLSTQIVPAVVILIANLMSGRHGSLRWETVTAIFGWTSLISIVASVAIIGLASDTTIQKYLFQIGGFCLLTALARDYEKILRPLFPWNH